MACFAPKEVVQPLSTDSNSNTATDVAMFVVHNMGFVGLDGRMHTKGAYFGEDFGNQQQTHDPYPRSRARRGHLPSTSF